MSIIEAGSSKWVIRDKNIKIQNCLQDTNKIKIYRAIKISTSQLLIVKIIKAKFKRLQIYQIIVKNALLFHRTQKRTSDLILPQDHVSGYYSMKDLPKAQNQQEQYCHLYLIRPYFAGSNFHEAIYANEKIPYQEKQFNIFIKQSIKLMTQIYYVQLQSPTFLPTLENIYFDGVKLNANLLSVESLLFLKHKMTHISIQNFKHLYPLLKSDVQIFVDWQKLSIYMSQQMLCRAILILWICFMTKRSPVSMVWQMNLNDQQLQWDRLILNNNNINYNNNKQPQKTIINSQNKIISLIRDAPTLWTVFLNKPENKKCFQIFSQMIFNQTNPQHNKQIKQQHKDYFFNLFFKVFIKQQHFGWKQLLKCKEILLYLRQTYIEPQQKPKFKLFKSPSKHKKIKIQVAKQAFIQLHQYLLYKDINKMKLNKQKATKYAKRLHFSSYIPFKIGLSIEYTLNYENWFEIFFVQHQDNKPQVYDAANYLFEMVQQQSGSILSHVKSAQLYHIKQILYLLGRKIDQNKRKKQTYQKLQAQVKSFVSDTRTQQYSLMESFKTHLKAASKSKTQKPLPGQLIQYCKYQDNSDGTYDDLIIPYAAYFQRQQRTRDQSKNEVQTAAQHDRVLKQIGPLFCQKLYQFLQYKRKLINQPQKESFKPQNKEIKPKQEQNKSQQKQKKRQPPPYLKYVKLQFLQRLCKDFNVLSIKNK